MQPSTSLGERNVVMGGVETAGLTGVVAVEEEEGSQIRAGTKAMDNSRQRAGVSSTLHATSVHGAFWVLRRVAASLKAGINCLQATSEERERIR